MFWVAICQGGKVAAYRPDGMLERAIDMPVRLVSSVAFGGPDLDRLFVTTTAHGIHGYPVEDGAGALYVIDGLVAHAESYSLGRFLDKGRGTGRVLAGRYTDRPEKRDGEWRIVLRRSTVEIALEGKATLPTDAPLPGSGYLRGNRDGTDPSYERPLGIDSGERWQPMSYAALGMPRSR